MKLDEPKSDNLISHWPLTLLSCLAAVGNVVIPLVLVRSITVDEVGIYKVFFLYLMMAPLFSMASGLVNGFAYWSGQSERSLEAIKTSSFLLLMIAAGFTLLSLLFVPQLAAIFSWPDSYVYLFCLCIAPSILHNYYEELAIAHKKVLGGAIFYSGFEVSRALLITSLAIYYQSLYVVLLTHLIVSYMKLIAGVSLAALSGFIGLPNNGTITKAVGKYALPVSAAWVFGVFINHADQFLLSIMISRQDFALYAIGCLAIPPLYILEHSITRVLIPRLSSALASKDFSQAAKLYSNSVLSLGLILIPSVAGLFVFADPIVEILFTTEYSSAGTYLKIFAFSYLALIIPFDAMARAQGDSKWIFNYFLGFSLLSVAMTAIGVFFFGPIGALVGLLTSKGAMRVFTVWYLQKSYSWKLVDIVPIERLTVFVLLSVVLSIGAILLKPAFTSQTLWFLVAGSCFAFLYLLLVMAIKDRPLSGEAGVLIVSQSIEIGGLEKVILYLARGLKTDHKIPVAVFCYDHQAPAEYSLVDCFDQYEIPVSLNKKTSGFSFSTVRNLLNMVYQQNITILHAHDLGSLIYCVIAKFLCPYRIKLVLTQHSFVHLGRHSRYLTYEKFFTRFVDEVCVVSEEVKEQYISHNITSMVTHIVSNGVDFPSSKRTDEEKSQYRGALCKALPLTKQHQSKVWLLYLARVYPGKGQSDALAVWNRLPDKTREQSCLLFVGPASTQQDKEQLNELISISKNSDNIVYIDGTREPENWYLASDLYISCSESEGMPLGPLEAAVYGLPCLLSDISGHRLLNDCAEFLPLNDFEAAARIVHNKINQILSDNSSVMADSWKHSHEIRNAYSTQEMVRKYQLVYCRLMANNNTMNKCSSSWKAIDFSKRLAKTFKVV